MMKNNIMKMLNNNLMNLPTPATISYKWNYGFMLGMTLGMQILTGLMLTMHYVSDVTISFSSVIEMTRNLSYGWWLRFIHANGASLFFILMYTHAGRGLYYMSYKFTETWNVGVIIILLSMVAAFFGYVLPWGQMSFWGATVITNLLSVIPYLGKFLVEWVWGGFSVANPTLNRFYTFHFITPFVILVMVILHLMFLHETGSSSPSSLNSNLDKLVFHPYFLLKDMFVYILILTLFGAVLMQTPNALGDPENFIPANPLVTPPHIQPEWYLLFAYSILRAIPNKLGGVIALVLSILILMILPFMPKPLIMSTKFLPLNKILFWLFLMIILLLTWLGACPVEAPYILAGQIVSFGYFTYFIFLSALSKTWMNTLYK